MQACASWCWHQLYIVSLTSKKLQSMICLNKQTSKQTNKQPTNQTNEQASKQTNKQASKQTNKKKHVWKARICQPGPPTRLLMDTKYPLRFFVLHTPLGGSSGVCITSPHDAVALLMCVDRPEDWWVVADRRFAYPQPFWRARTEWKILV